MLVAQRQRILAEAEQAKQNAQAQLIQIAKRNKVGEFKLIQGLVNVGADIYAKDEDGKSPMDYAEAQARNKNKLIRMLEQAAEQSSAASAPVARPAKSPVRDRPGTSNDAAAESNAPAESNDNPPESAPVSESNDAPAHVSVSSDAPAAAPPPAAAPDKQAPWLVWLQECVGGPDANDRAKQAKIYADAFKKMSISCKEDLKRDLDDAKDPKNADFNWPDSITPNVRTRMVRKLMTPTELLLSWLLPVFAVLSSVLTFFTPIGPALAKMVFNNLGACEFAWANELAWHETRLCPPPPPPAE